MVLREDNPIAVITDGDEISFLDTSDSDNDKNTTAILLGVYTDARTGVVLNKTMRDFSNGIFADGQHIEVRNTSGSGMVKGEVVFISGYNPGQDLPEVDLADASTTATMQALALIAETTLANNANGEACISGRMDALDTSAFTAGDDLYVSETAGEFTNVKPTGVALVQKIAIVLRSHVSLGVIEILGAGRENDIPNTMPDNVFTVADDADDTKQVDMSVGGATTSTKTTLTFAQTANRAITFPDADITVGASVVGTHHIFIPALSFYPATTNPCSDHIKSELVTNDVDIFTLDFAGSTTNEIAKVDWIPPENWNAGTVNIKYYWTAAAGAGTVEFETNAVAISNDDPLDAAFGTAVAVTDTFIAADDLHITPQSAAITIGGTPTNADWVQFKLVRDQATDTKAEDAKFIGAVLEYTIDAATSSG